MTAQPQAPGLAEAAVQLATVTTLFVFSIPVTIVGVYLLVIFVSAMTAASTLAAVVSAFLGFWVLQAAILEASRRVFLLFMTKFILTLPDPGSPR